MRISVMAFPDPVETRCILRTLRATAVRLACRSLSRGIRKRCGGNQDHALSVARSCPATDARPRVEYYGDFRAPQRGECNICETCVNPTRNRIRSSCAPFVRLGCSGDHLRRIALQTAAQMMAVYDFGMVPGGRERSSDRHADGSGHHDARRGEWPASRLQCKVGDVMSPEVNYVYRLRNGRTTRHGR